MHLCLIIPSSQRLKTDQFETANSRVACREDCTAEVGCKVVVWHGIYMFIFTWGLNLPTDQALWHGSSTFTMEVGKPLTFLTMSSRGLRNQWNHFIQNWISGNRDSVQFVMRRGQHKPVWIMIHLLLSVLDAKDINILSFFGRKFLFLVYYILREATCVYVYLVYIYMFTGVLTLYELCIVHVYYDSWFHFCSLGS